MTVPTGNPSWVKTASAADYGAHPGLHDYGYTGAINANTDITADQYKRLAADVAAATLMSPLATLTLRWTTAPAVYVSSAIVQWATPLFIEYAGSSPPSPSYPTVTISGTKITVALPSSANDTYGKAGEIIVRVVAPTVTGILWAGPNGTSTFELNSNLFSSGGSATIMVF